MSDIVEKIKNERRWLEKSLLISEYHSSQQSKFGKTRGLKWTLYNTAVHLNLSVGYVSESIKLAKGHAKGLNFDEMTRENALKMLRSHE